MKRKTIIGLVVLGGFASLLLLSFGDQVGGYMNLRKHTQLDLVPMLVGHWVRPEAARYDPATNLFSFYLEDDQEEVRLVHYQNPKPASFEDAEKIVVEGHLGGDVFQADRILMKCPSKYSDTRALEEEASPAP